MKIRTYAILANLALCSGVALAGYASTTGTFDGFYRSDRWGEGTFAHFNVSPGLQKELEPFEGHYVTVSVRKADQESNPGPATLYKIWNVKEAAEPRTNLRVVAHLAPASLEPSTAFGIDIMFTNTGTERVIVSSEGAHIRITAEAHDPMEVQQHWSNLWGNYESYPSHTGIALISTEGYLNQNDGVVSCPASGTMHDIPLAPGKSFTLSLLMKQGLPAGKYEVAVGAVAYPPGDDRKKGLSRAWLRFDIEGKAANNRHTRAQIAERHAVAGTNGIIYGAIYAPLAAVPLHTVGTNSQEIAKVLGPAYPVNVVWLPEDTHEEIHDTFDARWYIIYANDGRPLKIERATIVKDAKANQASEVTARNLAEPQR